MGCHSIIPQWVSSSREKIKNHYYQLILFVVEGTKVTCIFLSTLTDIFLIDV